MFQRVHVFTGLQKQNHLTQKHKTHSFCRKINAVFNSEIWLRQFLGKREIIRSNSVTQRETETLQVLIWGVTFHGLQRKENAMEGNETETVQRQLKEIFYGIKQFLKNAWKSSNKCFSHYKPSTYSKNCSYFLSYIRNNLLRILNKFSFYLIRF